MAHAVSMQLGEGATRWQHIEVRVARHLRDLFDRLPTLAAFRLRSDLMVADVSIVGCSNDIRIRRLQVNVMQAFVELAECDLEVIACMRGRSFARSRPCLTGE
jgi:hypothetical protein